MISNPSLMLSLGKGALTTEIAALIARSEASETRVFKETDLPPLLYLDHLVNEISTQGFEHVVIDEAQELSPLQFLLLRRHSRNGWFTILGDLRQRLLPYQGIHNWRQVASLFSSTDVARLESRISFRSTYEITRFANRVARQLPGSSSLPIPYQRYGEKLKGKRSETFRAMQEAIIQRFSQLRAGHEDWTVAILTKWLGEANTIFKELGHRGYKGVQLLEIEEEMNQKLIVSPIQLTKGLEFDAVIIAGVHDRNFVDSEFDRRLLYLACTRAKHSLSMYWFGQPSPILTQLPKEDE
ncbi:MAG: ATP-binding domain-containing protein [Chloroflexi bacterium]|nr:ATP-binding domain-containing protein [Chloroflexota bacterium]